ncbi:MAG: hypothetical protein R3B90_18665 [Planctomycetaceae bacterium]
MSRLIELLMTQLAAGERVRVRRANVLDLLQSTLHRCQTLLASRRPEVESLHRALGEQRQTLARKMAVPVADGTAQRSKPVGAAVALGRHRLVGLQSLLIGAATVQRTGRNDRVDEPVPRPQHRADGPDRCRAGGRWLKERQSEKQADATLDRVSLLGLDDSLLRETELVIEGHVQSAGFSRQLASARKLGDLRQQASRVEGEFLGDARGRIDDVIAGLAERNSRLPVRLWYELMFMVYLGFILYRRTQLFLRIICQRRSTTLDRLLHSRGGLLRVVARACW